MICAIDIEINNPANIYQTEYNSAKVSSVIHNLIITKYTITLDDMVWYHFEYHLEIHIQIFDPLFIAK